MTSRERILNVLNRKTPDRIPWAPLIDGYYLSSVKQKINQVDAIRDFGGDVFARHIPTFKQTTANKSLAATRLGSSEDDNGSTNNISYTAGSKGDIEVSITEIDGNITEITKTPLGTLQSKFVRNEISPFIPFPTEHKIKTIEDLKIFRYVVENLEYEPTYNLFEKEEIYIGSDGLATTTSPSAPFHSLMEIEFGIENFYYMINDYQTELEELMDVMHERNKEIYKIIAASPAKVVIDYENTSTTTQSPAIYEKYVERQINDYVDILHKSDKILLIHMCGKLKGLEKQIARGGMDGIVDIAPQPTGDVSLGEARRMWGSDKIVMGGIDATAFKGLTPDGMSEYVKDILKDLGSGEGVLLGSADATPQGTSIENLRAVTEVVRECGKYPLNSK